MPWWCFAPTRERQLLKDTGQGVSVVCHASSYELTCSFLKCPGLPLQHLPGGPHNPSCPSNIEYLQGCGSLKHVGWCWIALKIDACGLRGMMTCHCSHWYFGKQEKNMIRKKMGPCKQHNYTLIDRFPDVCILRRSVVPKGCPNDLSKTQTASHNHLVTAIGDVRFDRGKLLWQTYCYKYGSRVTASNSISPSWAVTMWHHYGMVTGQFWMRTFLRNQKRGGGN